MPHPLVTRYVLARGWRIAVLVLLGMLGVWLVRFVPPGPVWVLLRLAVLLSVLAWVFARLKSAALSFFIGALLALLLFQLPLPTYVELSAGQAQSSTVFLIVLFGATLAMVSRQDLLDALLRLQRTAIITPKSSSLSAHMVVSSVFLGVLLATLLAQFFMYTFPQG